MSDTSHSTGPAPQGHMEHGHIRGAGDDSTSDRLSWQIFALTAVGSVGFFAAVMVLVLF